MTVRHKQQQAFTLIELTLAIVIISIALSGILSVINLTASHSADPVVQQQAVAIAESYLEEILATRFCEDFKNGSVNCTDITGPENGETRSSYDDVDDYNGLSDATVITRNGTVITALADYSVNVSVTKQNVNSVAMKKITVSVSGPGTSALMLTGYRAQF